MQDNIFAITLIYLQGTEFIRQLYILSETKLSYETKEYILPLDFRFMKLV